MIKRIREKLRKFNRSTEGMTLVEMLVCFMLIGIFMIAAVQVITSTMLIYDKARSQTYGMEVTATLEDKISGKLWPARSQGTGGLVTIYNGAITDYEDGIDSTNPTLSLAEDEILGNAIAFRDATNAQVLIYANTDGEVIIHYGQVTKDEDGTDVTTAPVDWKFDSSSYMGYKVSDLTFSLANSEDASYPKNVIKCEITLTSEDLGSYKATKYITLSNFADAADNGITIQN